MEKAILRIPEVALNYWKEAENTDWKPLSYWEYLNKVVDVGVDEKKAH